jgi:hypothetical protein
LDIGGEVGGGVLCDLELADGCLQLPNEVVDGGRAAFLLAESPESKIDSFSMP